MISIGCIRAIEWARKVKVAFVLQRWAPAWTLEDHRPTYLPVEATRSTSSHSCIIECKTKSFSECSIL